VNLRRWRLILLIYILAIFTSAPNAAQTAPLGRLFFTPNERAQLEKLHEEKIKSPTLPEKELPPPEVYLNGLVIRSHGPSSAWINGKTALKQAGVEVNLDPSRYDAVSITIINGNQQLLLKPGQKVNTETNEIQENYQGDGQASPAYVAAENNSEHKADLPIDNFQTLLRDLSLPYLQIAPLTIMQPTIP